MATLTQNGAEHPLKLRVEREREVGIREGKAGGKKKARKGGERKETNPFLRQRDYLIN